MGQSRYDQFQFSALKGEMELTMGFYDWEKLYTLMDEVMQKLKTDGGKVSLLGRK